MKAILTIANLAKAEGAKLALSYDYKEIADKIVEDMPELYDFIKHNNISPTLSGESLIYKEIVRKFFGLSISRDADIMIRFTDLDYQSVSIEDANHLALAEKVENVLKGNYEAIQKISPQEPQKQIIEKHVTVTNRTEKSHDFWKCPYCGKVNDGGTKCDNCGAGRKWP